MICVLTMPGRPYLLQTLEDIDSSAQSQHRVIVSDCRTVPADSTVRRHGWDSRPFDGAGTPGHNKWPFWHCLRAAAGTGSDLLFFEDDVRLSKNAARYAEHWLQVPGDLAWVSLYAPWGDSEVPWGLCKVRAAGFNFCQALKIPNRTIQELVGEANTGEMENSMLGGSDDVLREIGGRRKWSYGVHFPGVVQHVGEQSAVCTARTLSRERVSKTWLGLDFDALILVNHVDYS